MKHSNHFYSIISVTLVLILFGLVSIGFFQAQNLATHFKEQVNIVVELKAETSEKDIKKVQEKIENSPVVKEGSISFISKEAGAKMLTEEFGEELLSLQMSNPLHDIVTFNLKARYISTEYFEKIRAQVVEYPPVQDVYYQEGLVGGFMDNINTIGYVILGLAIMLLLIALALIYNTIRLTIHSNRKLIKNMQLIGAAPSFVSRPFFLKSFRNGLVSSLMAMTVLGMLILLVMGHLPVELIAESSTLFIGLSGGLLILGVVMNLFSTYLTVNKYLRTNLEDLHS